MKRHIFIVGSMLTMGALLADAAVQDEKSDSPKADPQMKEMMQKMETAGTPGAAHKALDPLVGEWNTEVKAWTTPDAPPTVTKGTAKADWILDGRFVQEEFNGEFMGKPFHGIGVTGYDNTKHLYVNGWIDDMHTSLFASTGKPELTATGRDESTAKVIIFEGKYDCPLTGRKDVTMKQVLRIIDNDKHVLELHDPSKTGNTKTMEITYTRK